MISNSHKSLVPLLMGLYAISLMAYWRPNTSVPHTCAPNNVHIFGFNTVTIASHVYEVKKIKINSHDNDNK